MNGDSARVPRGVYISPGVGPGGEKMFVAVDGSGRKVFDATVYPEYDTFALEDALWRLLDRYDPPGERLRLIP